MAERAGAKPEIMIADDDPEDCFLIERAIREARCDRPIRCVADGEELLEALRKSVRKGTPPSIVLLDLNMPKKDGREALKEIKGERALRRIPVIVLTTSSSPEDVARAYDLGVNAVVTKPSSFPEFVEAMRRLDRFWLGLADLPPSFKGVS